MGLSLVMDRSYPSEYVYATAYRRQTNYQTIWRADRRYAAMGTTVVVPLLRDYALARKDDLVQPAMLLHLHDLYLHTCPFVMGAELLHPLQ
jgi:hypothetical protein